MQKLFVGLGLAFGLLGLAGPGLGFEYLNEPRLHDAFVQATHQPASARGKGAG